MPDRETNLSNFASTTLTAFVANDDDTFPVDSIVGFVSPCIVTFAPDDVAKREIIICDGVFTATELVTTNAEAYPTGNRGHRGSVSGRQSHEAGTVVTIAPLEQHIEDIHDRIDAVQTELDSSQTDIDTNAADILASQAEIAIISPVGSMTMWPGASAPAQWKVCDGAAISRTTFSDLFAVIGETFGAGNGTTTFNLPDMRGRVPVGVGTLGADTYARAGIGGAAEQALTEAQLAAHTHAGATHTHTGPSHNHSVDPPNTSVSNDTHGHSVGTDTHEHSLDFSIGGWVSGMGYTFVYPGSDQSGRNSNKFGSISTDTHGHSLGNDTHGHTVNIAAFNSALGGTGNTGSATGTTGSKGSGSAVDMRQPYLGLNYIIFAGV